MDLSKNSISSLTGFQHLSKMKQLIADENSISDVSFSGLSGLEHISLRQNKVRDIPDTADLRKLVNLDLSHNTITGGYANLAKLKALRVLDLSYNGISVSPAEFHATVLAPLRQLTKLEYLALEGNPVTQAIRDYRLYVISELPKLHYLDWAQVTKDERVQAAAMDARKAWDFKTAPLTTVTLAVAPQQPQPPQPPPPQQQQTATTVDSFAPIDTQQQQSTQFSQQEAQVPTLFPSPGSADNLPVFVGSGGKDELDLMGAPTLVAVTQISAASLGCGGNSDSGSDNSSSNNSSSGGGGDAAAAGGGDSQFELEDLLASLPSVSSDSTFNFDDYNERLIQQDAQKATTTTTTTVTAPPPSQPSSSSRNESASPPLPPSGTGSPMPRRDHLLTQKTSTPPVRMHHTGITVNPATQIVAMGSRTVEPKHDSLLPPPRKPLTKVQLLNSSGVGGSGSGSGSGGSGDGGGDTDDKCGSLSSATVYLVQPLKATPEPPVGGKQLEHKMADTYSVEQSLDEITAVFDADGDDSRNQAILDDFLRDIECSSGGGDNNNSSSSAAVGRNAAAAPVPAPAAPAAQESDMQLDFSDLDSILSGMTKVSEEIAMQNKVEKKRQSEEEERERERVRLLEAERKQREEAERLEAERKRREKEEEERKQARERERVRLEAERKQREEAEMAEAERKKKEEQEAVAAAASARSKKMKIFESEKITLIERLGDGALGDTYKFSYTGDHRPYTLKILRPQPSNSSKEVIAIDDEIARLAGIKKSKNVVPVAGAASVVSGSGSLGYVAGYCAGPCVTEFTRTLRAQEKLSERLEIAKGIARGLAHLHANGVLHGALKPADIVLTDDLTPMIRDYGFIPLKARTISSGVLLHPFYVAPEIIAAATTTTTTTNSTDSAVALPYTAQSDLYSLGVVLWELFEGAEKDVSQEYRPGRPLRLTYAATPAEIVSVVERCCRTVAGARPASAAAVASELNALSVGALHPGELPADLSAERGKVQAVARRIVTLLQSGQTADIGRGVRGAARLGESPERMPILWEEGLHMCMVRLLLGRQQRQQQQQNYGDDDNEGGVVDVVVRELQALCNESAEFRAQLGRVILPEILLGLLARDRNEILLGRALLLIATLLREDGVRRALYANGVTRQLLRHMFSHNDMVAMNAARAVAAYLRLPEARDSFLTAKGAQVVATLLARNADSNPGLTVFLLGILAHLFQHERAVPALLEYGVHTRVRALLQARTGLLTLAAAKCAAALAASPAGRAAHPPEEWLPLLIPLLTAPAPKLRAYACLALARLAATGDDFCDKLESAGVIPSLLALLDEAAAADCCCCCPSGDASDDKTNTNNTNTNSNGSEEEIKKKKKDRTKLIGCALELLTRLARCISCRDAIIDINGVERIVAFHSAYTSRHPEDYAMHLAGTNLFLALVADNDPAMEALCEHDAFAQRLVRQPVVAAARRDDPFLLASLHLVAALAAGSSAVVDVVLRAGGLSKAIDLLENAKAHMVSKDIAPVAGAAVAALFRYDAALEVLEKIPRGFYTAFSLLLASDIPHVQEALLAQLYARCCSQQKTLLFLVKMGLLAHLARLLNDLSSHVRVHSKALQLVILTLKTPSLKEELARNDIPQALSYLAANTDSPLIKNAATKVLVATKSAK